MKEFKKKKPTFWKKVIISFLVILFLLAILYLHRFYTYVYQPNITLNGGLEKYLYIPTNSTFSDVEEILIKEGLLIDKNSFDWVAERKNYRSHVKPGKYLINREMNNNELVDLLRSGNQIPVRIRFQNIRTKEQLAGLIGRELEADSVAILSLFEDLSLLDTNHLNTENIACIFIPNTYEFYWNTSAKQFVERMLNEHQKFWTSARLQKAKIKGMTVAEISVLASIVEKETALVEEMPIVAGLYLNRLRRGMKLQADPTVIFANGDFTVRRVLRKDLLVESPYNTYLHEGLPPGPICLPSIQAIDAVLNAAQHDYIFMCAKEDFSGCHNFAISSAEHENNARIYREALDNRKIMR